MTSAHGLLRPDWYGSSLAHLSFDALAMADITTLFLDMDNTVLSRKTHEVPPEISRWIADGRSRGLKLCLISNNFHAHAYEVAQTLELPVVAKALKPLPTGVFKALHLMGAQKEKSALLGDQLFTDILAARAAGIRALLVEPLAAEDLWYTLLLRRLQRHVLGDMSMDTERIAENG
jgi:uncharacterized protein